jgi:GAF domain-containing protein
MLFTRSYPVPAEEVSRLAELKRYKVLDSDPERVFDDLVRLASSLFRTKSSVISLIDDDRQWFKARQGVDFCETGRSEAFCAHAILSKEVMVVLNASEDPRFCANPLVVGPPFIRFYAGAPLTSPRGFNIGTSA